MEISDRQHPMILSYCVHGDIVSPLESDASLRWTKADPFGIDCPVFGQRMYICRYYFQFINLDLRA